jgi:hypothetical protein
MKIQKFNENIEAKNYHVCMIVNSSGGIDYSGVFDTEENMNNWILNTANEIVLDRTESGSYWDSVFTDVVEAINWIQDETDCNVNYDDESEYHAKVKLKYGVEKLRASKKYNL